MYASSPFYMGKANDPKGSWFGVYHNTAAPSDFWVFNDKTNGNTFVDTFSVGGVGDLYLIFGQTPDIVISKYQSIIGRPALMPQWSLGWHQSKYGYNNTQDLRDSMQKYLAYELPIDSQWTDIDIMESFKLFTVDQARFGDILEFVNQIHYQGVKFVPIIDSGIASRPNEDYAPYKQGLEQDVFIKNPIDQTQPLLGNSWPVETVYPDFFAKMTDTYWANMLAEFRKLTNFDGVWLEMNEIESFCNGPCSQDQTLSNPVMDQLYYIPGGRSLEEKTLSLDGVHANGFSELHVHNLFATL